MDQLQLPILLFVRLDLSRSLQIVGVMDLLFFFLKFTLVEELIVLRIMSFFLRWIVRIRAWVVDERFSSIRIARLPLQCKLFKKFIIWICDCCQFLTIELSCLRLIFNQNAFLVKVILLEPFSKLSIAASIHKRHLFLSPHIELCWSYHAKLSTKSAMHGYAIITTKDAIVNWGPHRLLWVLLAIEAHLVFLFSS